MRNVYNKAAILVYVWRGDLEINEAARLARSIAGETLQHVFVLISHVI